MPASHRNRVKMTVTGTPATGTITLAAASSGYQSFASAYAADATVDILITDGTAWEVARNCAYTNSGTTVTRGTFEASSTGSAVSLTSAAVVSVIATADRGRTWDAAAMEHTSASPTTADPTVAINTLHFLDLSGLTADRNFTLPATAEVGDRVGLYVTTGDDTYELIVKANTGDTLNGVSAAEWSRVYITGECLVMRCITANAAWVVEYDGRLPASCFVTNDNSTTDTLASGGFTKVSAAFTTVSNNAATIWSTANKRMDARRAGVYNISANGAVANQTDGKYAIAALYKNGSAVVRGHQGSAAANGQVQGANVVAVLTLAAGDYVELYSYNGDTVSHPTTAASANIWFSATEIL